MDKEAVVQIYDGILFSIKRNTFESVLMRWMNLEPTIQSEVSQKKKYKYHILTHICGIQKDGTGGDILGATVETQRQSRLVDTVWGAEGECGIHGESDMGTCVTTRKIDVQWESAV